MWHLQVSFVSGSSKSLVPMMRVSSRVPGACGGAKEGWVQMLEDGFEEARRRAWHCHSTLSLAVIGWHCLGIHTVTLLPWLRGGPTGAGARHDRPPWTRVTQHLWDA
jgi:hypothetical protein